MNTAEAREIKQDLKRLSAVVEKSLKNGANSNDFLSSINTDEIERLARKAGKDVRSFLTSKSEQAGELYHTAEQQVKKHPVQSVAIALAAGLVLSTLFRRS